MTRHIWTVLVFAASLPGHGVMLSLRSDHPRNTSDPVIAELICGGIIWTLVGALSRNYVRRSPDGRAAILRASLCPVIAIAVWALIVATFVAKTHGLPDLSDYPRFVFYAAAWATVVHLPAFVILPYMARRMLRLAGGTDPPTPAP